MPRRAGVARRSCLFCNKKDILAEDLQRHKFQCLRHAFAAVRLHRSSMSAGDGEIEHQTNAVGDGGIEHQTNTVSTSNDVPATADQTSIENTDAPLLNDLAAAANSAAEMEDSWKSWYKSRGRKF